MHCDVLESVFSKCPSAECDRLGLPGRWSGQEKMPLIMKLSHRYAFVFGEGCKGSVRGGGNQQGLHDHLSSNIAVHKSVDQAAGARTEEVY